jgi:hypothetical protein
MQKIFRKFYFDPLEIFFGQIIGISEDKYLKTNGQTDEVNPIYPPHLQKKKNICGVRGMGGVNRFTTLILLFK